MFYGFFPSSTGHVATCRPPPREPQKRPKTKVQYISLSSPQLSLSGLVLHSHPVQHRLQGPLHFLPPHRYFYQFSLISPSCPT